jgi:hypothetical protein
MKKIIFLLVLITLTISCDTTECGCSIPSERIVGRWNGTDITINGTTQVILPNFPIPVPVTIIGEGYDLDFTYTLTENPNKATSEGVYSMKITASAIGQSYAENQENLEVDFSGPWSQDNDLLTMTVNGQEATATILELTATTLIIEFPTEQMVTYDGQDIIINAITTISFSR